MAVTGFSHGGPTATVPGGSLFSSLWITPRPGRFCAPPEDEEFLQQTVTSHISPQLYL